MKSEAEIFSRYIIGKAPSKELIHRYEDGKQILGLTEIDKISQYCLRYPFLLPFFDAGLTFKNREHPLVRKLLLMFAILETTPEFSNDFLAQRRSFLYFFTVFFIGLRAVIKSLLGILLVSLIAKKDLKG